MRVGYFGPPGTFTQEALLATGPADGLELVPLATIHDTVMAVADGRVQRALVPIENSIEGGVGATLDALAFETDSVAIVGEVVHPIHHCLIARAPVALERIEAVISHPQASAQCARFLRTRLPTARVLAGTSTADAVRTVVSEERPWAAIGNALAARRYGGVVLEEGIEDVAGNETRFVWLGPAAAARSQSAVPAEPVTTSGPRPPAEPVTTSGPQPPAEPVTTSGPQPPAEPAPPSGPTAWKTAVVFWGVGAERPGWLVACLSEFARRQVNLTRIESRPLKQGLGRYVFFLDLEGALEEPRVAASLAGLREHVDVLRVLGSFPAAGA